MIQEYLILASSLLAGLIIMVGAAFALRRSDWMAKPPGIDLVVIMLTVVPGVYVWIKGVQIHQHWAGGFAGFAVASVCQFIALELFHLFHTWHATRKGVANLRINHTIGSRFGHWRNRLGLWVTVPSVPFFLVNRMGHFTGYIPLMVVLDFPRFNHADYISVSRQKIENLIGADLVWCLYCDWMTGGWSLTTAMLNEVESFWCPLTFVDREKCEKCSHFFRMDLWAPSNATPEQMREALNKTQAARGSLGCLSSPVHPRTVQPSRIAEPVGK
jgi:hypothetical protein